MATNSVNREFAPPDLSPLVEGRAAISYVGWNGRTDVLFIALGDRRRVPAATIPVGDLLVRFDAETGEVFGVEIEHFASHVLPANPAIGEAWAILGELTSQSAAFEIHLPSSSQGAAQNALRELASTAA